MATAVGSSAADSMDQVIKQPLDLVRLALGEVVRVKMRGNRELRGKLHAYDCHLNMVLGDVEETAEITEVDEKTDEEVVKVITRSIPMLFVRGDCIILIAPPLRTATI